MKKIMLTGALLMGSLVSFSAAAAEMSEEEMQQKAVVDRQAVFKLLSAGMGPLGGMARGGEYDADLALLSAERIALLAGFLPEMFAMDTSGSGIESRSQDSIWGSLDDFNSLAADLTEGANTAIGILNAQGADGIRGAVGAIGQKCGACHDRFRTD